MAARSRRAVPVLARAVPLAGFAVIAGTLLVGQLTRDGDVRFGAPVPPLLSPWMPAISVWAALAVPLLAAGVLVAPRLRAPRLGPAGFAAAVFALALVLRLVCAAARQGPHGWVQVFDDSFEASNEYLPALPALHLAGAGYFLDRFAELVPSLPVHVAGHPPGLLLLMDVLGIGTPAALSALLIVAGTLAVPLTYALGRALGSEPAARVAALLLAFAPSSMLFAVTSADALYAALGTAAAAALLARRRVRVALGPVLLAIASFFSWALLAVGAVVALVLVRRDGLRRAVLVSLACALALLVLYGALFLLTGFDPLATLRSTDQVYRAGIASTRPYLFWLFGSPAAFGIALGLPITWFALRALGRGSTPALALAAVVLLAALGGYTKAETERIWLFFAPVACVAAAEILPARRLKLVLGLLAGQALAVELLFYTVW